MNGKCKTERGAEKEICDQVEKSIQQATGREKNVKEITDQSHWKETWLKQCNIVECLQIMSGPSDHVREYICKRPAVSISAPLSGAAPLSPLSLLCRGYCEASAEPTSVRCQRTLGEVKMRGVGWWWWWWEGVLRKRPVDLDHSQGQSGFYSG